MIQEAYRDDGLFERASEQLKRLGELKEKELLDDALYQELRAPVLAQMKRALTETPAQQVSATLAPAPTPAVVADLHAQPAYGLLHQQIVDKISESYAKAEADEDQKQFMLRALAALADQHVLNPGDSAVLTRLIDVASAPDLPETVVSTENRAFLLEKLLTIHAQFNEINATISQNPAASQTSIVLVQVTVQSGQRATEEIRIQSAKPNSVSPKALWRQLVQQDLTGGLVGAGAATSLFTAPLVMLGPIGLSTVGVVGTLIGAGVSSGIAWRDHKKKG